MTNYKEALVSHYKDLEKATKTGFREIDAVGGFPKSKLIVVTGRPSCGKTSFALSVAYKAIKDGKKIVILSQQMTEQEIVCRFVSYETEVALQQVMYDPTWVETENKAFHEAMALLEGKDFQHFQYEHNSLVLKYLAGTSTLDGIVVDSYQMFNDYDFVYKLYKQAKNDGYWIMVVSDIDEGGKKFISKRELLAKDKLFQLADMVIKVDNEPTDILEFGGGDPYGKGVIEIVKSRHTREFNFLCDYDRLTGRFTDSKNA